MTQPDRTLGHYRVLAPLGRGGMGEVFVAEDVRLGRNVALKVLPADVAGSADRRDRFEREARAVAALSHPNILAIHEFGEDDGVAYAAMELLEGETLRSRLDRGAVPTGEAIEHARRMADGLSAAHERGIVHRDLKPENVFLTRDGQLKILDFGLARLTTPPPVDASTVAGLTEPGMALGTVGYAAPEQMRGGAADARADIFSLGAILYEMLSGHRAFRGVSSFDVIAASLNDEAPPLAVSGSNAGAIERVVRRCLEKRPDRRFQTARDLGFALGAVAGDPASGPAAPEASRHRWLAAGVLLVLLLGAAATYVVGTRMSSRATGAPTGGPNQPLRIAVLPFENLGLPEDEYFADGVTEEITSRLAALSGLGVISRSSAAQYAKAAMSTRDIGNELGAAYILQGGIRWERDGNGPGHVRITPQLIRVADDTHVWVRTYDMVLGEIFDIQSDIAERVAESLDVTLLAPQRGMESGATKDPEAYQAYLRGIHAASSGDSISPSGSQRTVDAFERAVALDPGFALAHARLSLAHSTLYRLGFDVSDARLASALASAERARGLQADLAWSHLALGSYYYARDEYDRAREEFLVAQKGMPGSSEVYRRLAATERRQGRLDEALGLYQRASELDPRSAAGFRDIAMTYGMLRRYDDAIGYQDRAIALDPDQVITFWEKAASQLNVGRPLDDVRRTLERMPQTEDPYVLRAWLRLELFARNYRAALARIKARPDGFVDQVYFWPQPLLLGDAYRFLGEFDGARPMYEAARATLERERDARPDDARVRSALGLAYAGLARKDDAIREARTGVDLLPITKDAMRAWARVEDLARVYTLVGEPGAALDELERLLSMPTFFFSVNVLQLDPAWDPLRSHPRYSKIVAAHQR